MAGRMIKKEDIDDYGLPYSIERCGSCGGRIRFNMRLDMFECDGCGSKPGQIYKMPEEWDFYEFIFNGHKTPKEWLEG